MTPMPLMTAAEEKAFDAKCFAAWMKKVEAVLEAKVGLSSSDLDDYLYDVAYEDGDSPKEVAMAALRNAGYDR